MRHRTTGRAGLAGSTAMLVIAALVAILGAAPASAAPAGSAPADSVSAGIASDSYCQVTVTVPGQWATGYTVSVMISNISTVPVRWTARLTVAPPAQVTQVWNGVATQSGTKIIIVPPPYPPGYGVIAPGQSTAFGYTGTGPLVYPEVTCEPAW